MKMANKIKSAIVISASLALLLSVGCGSNTAESKDSELVNKQQNIYREVQPVHIYDYSIPKDIYQQIYDVVTEQVVASYSVVETITGVTKYRCPSVGYPIPADTSLTNPLQGVHNVDGPGADDFEAVVEQAEPNGLFPSKNTDATWVMCVNLDTGEVYPFYAEHKVLTWPFIVEENEHGEWIRADNKPIKFVIEIRGELGGEQDAGVPKVK